ncbi:MAG: NnrU family protein, partial [Allosphingosinicella sp.]
MIALASLALATLAFVGTHLALSHPFRTRLVQNLGDQWFAVLYSAVAFITLGWMIFSYRAADDSFFLWVTPDWARPAAAAIMLLASTLLVGSFFNNPAFPRPGAKRRASTRAATGVFAVTRHPMNMAFTLWALVHIALWGALPNLIVAGGILILALLGSIGQDHKKLNVIGEPW